MRSHHFLKDHVSMKTGKEIAVLLAHKITGR